MSIEHVLIILKGTWRIAMRRVDVSLRHMDDIVATCIILHNMCIIEKDKFDLEWMGRSIKEIEW